MSAPSVSDSAINILPIRRLLQINVCILFCLAGVVFAAAEGNPLGLLSVPIGVAGLLLTDRRQNFRLSALWANLLGLGAFLAAGVEFFGESIEGRLLGFGHLLLYLGWILMLQHKGKPQFWWLCALSTLQVATASVLTNSLWFPLTAMLFIALALWTLSVFSLDRAVAGSAGVERAARLARGGTSLVENSGPDASGDRADASRSRSNVRTESAARWITPRFVLGVLMNSGLSLLLGLAIFVLTPRVWVGSFSLLGDSDLPAGQPLTGFAEEVSLGDMGEILENPEIVMEVAFFDQETGEKLNVEKSMAKLGYNAPLFRGKVLGRYDNGRWSTPAIVEHVNRFRVPFEIPLIRQRYSLHPIGTMTLFSADRAIGCRTANDVRISHDLFSRTFSVDPDHDGRRTMQRIFEYEAYSPLTGEASTRPPGNAFHFRSRDRYWRLLGEYRASMLALPDGLDRLELLTHKLTRPDDGTILSEAEIAQILVKHLRDSGDYGYSMKVSIDNPTIDPVEDFLFNRKQGHCEYYASALALMLRSAHIPSRLISGFKGGHDNTSTGQFEVRQLHAHAWVEALIDNQWVVLDATPSTRDDSVASISTSISPFAQAEQFLQSWWSQGLLMNQALQRQTLYEPLQNLFADSIDSVRRVGLVETIFEWFRQLSSNPDDWISWMGFLTAFTFCLLMLAIYWIGKQTLGALRGVVAIRRRRHRQQLRIVAFYERFRSLMARAGYTRDEAATQLEFAATIERDWSRRSDLDGLRQLPSRLTDAFYRVRFGDQPLDDAELADLDNSLGHLERWLRGDRSPATTPTAK